MSIKSVKPTPDNFAIQPGSVHRTSLVHAKKRGRVSFSRDWRAKIGDNETQPRFCRPERAALAGSRSSRL